MTDENGYAHAGGGELDVGIENLLRFHHQLPFFRGVTGIEERKDLRDNVEGDLLGKFSVFDRIGDKHGARLAEQFVHRLFAGARDGLIGRNDDTPDFGLVMKRLDRDDDSRRRAVRICDNAFGNSAFERLCIDLGNDEGNLAVHAPAGRVVDDQGACGGDSWRPFLRHLGAGHQRNVGALKIKVFERFYLQRAIAERHLGADRVRGRQRNHLARGKGALGENAQHLAADVSGRADHGNLVRHSVNPFARVDGAPAFTSNRSRGEAVRATCRSAR